MLPPSDSRPTIAGGSTKAVQSASNWLPSRSAPSRAATGARPMPRFQIAPSVPPLLALLCAKRTQVLSAPPTASPHQKILPPSRPNNCLNVGGQHCVHGRARQRVRVAVKVLKNAPTAVFLKLRPGRRHQNVGKTSSFWERINRWRSCHGRLPNL